MAGNILSTKNRVQSVCANFCNDLTDFYNQSIESSNRNQDIVKWIEHNRWIDGKPWSFESSGPKIEYGKYDVISDILPRPYLPPFLNDQSPERSAIKCRQSEFSETHINEGLYHALTRPSTRISHIFPTDELGNAISNEKIRTAIEGSPLINHELKQKSVHNYTFKNQSFYNISGALKRAGGRAGSRDIIMFDEVDSMSEAIFGVFEEMLSHSSMKYIRKFSTGTVPGVGIDKIVSMGSGFEWWVTCKKCKKSQTFSFPDNIINFFDINQFDPHHPDYLKKLDKVYIGCKYCGTYIDRSSKHYLNTSEWIARRPEMIGRHSSYYIVMAMIPWKTGREILRRYHELASYEWQFFNEVWGVAFLKGDYTLSELELRACEQQWSMVYQRIPVLQNVSVGIDWGEKSSWVVVMANGIDIQHPSKKCVVYVEEINQYSLERSGLKNISLNHVERVKQIVAAFGCEIIVNDANGLGVDRNSDLIQTYDKRAWGCFFDTAEQSRQLRKSTLQEPMWSKEKHKVTISKVNVWKTIQAEIRKQLIMFPSSQSQDGPTVNMFFHHMQALGIQSRFDVEKNREFEIVVKLHSNDHLADALMYANIGFHKLTGYQTGTVPGIVTPTTSTHRPNNILGV